VKKGLKLTLLALLLTAAFTATEALAAMQVDPKLKSYRKVSGITGNLNSVGSDTMNNLMTLWGEGFAKYYPGVNIQVEGKGSSTAPPALIEGASQFGPMSRKMKNKEVDKFEKKYGFKPTRFRTSLDALAVFVNKDNPIKGASLPEMDAVFGKNRKRGYHENITRWGQLGLNGEWVNKPITIFGRNSASGTYGYFKKVTMKKGDYKDQVKEQPGSASVVQGITEDPFAIGYSGIGYKTSGVRALPLAKKEGQKYYAAVPANVYSGKYPLSRYLNLYIVQNPNGGLDPLVKEFIKFIFSKEGQQVVIKDGYMPVSAKVAAAERAKLK